MCAIGRTDCRMQPAGRRKVLTSILAGAEKVARTGKTEEFQAGGWKLFVIVSQMLVDAQLRAG